jgi:hypothetical protein
MITFGKVLHEHFSFEINRIANIFLGLMFFYGNPVGEYYACMLWYFKVLFAVQH